MEQSFSSRIVAEIDAEIKRLYFEAAKLEKMKAQLGVVASSPAAKPAKAPKEKTGKRVRRSEEDLKALAEKVHGFIKSKGEGVKGGEIKEKFGLIQPTVKAFLKKHGFKVKTTGNLAAMVYHAE